VSVYPAVLCNGLLNKAPLGIGTHKGGMNWRRWRLSVLRPKTKKLNLLGYFTWIVYPIAHASE